MIDNVNALVNLLVAVVGAVSTVAGLVRRAYRAETRPESAPTAAESRPASAVPDPQRLVEIGFALLLAAVFSLLLTHTLVVSGRQVDLLGLTAAGLVITAVVTAIMIYAWKEVQLEFAVAAFAIITLVSLIMAPAGPLTGDTVQGEPAISPLVPSLALVTIASTLLLYLFGNPFGGGNQRRRRLAVAGLLVGIPLLASLACGLYIRDNYLFPGGGGGVLLRSDDALAVHRYLDHNLRSEPEINRAFYALASEHTLVPYYLRLYAEEYAGVAGEPDEPAPADPELDPYAGMEEPAPQMSSRVSEERLRQLRQTILDQQVQINDFGHPYDYMQNRLLWVHPVGARGEIKARIALPGATAIERLEGTAEYRIFGAFTEQPQIWRPYSRIFQYSGELHERMEAATDPQRKLLSNLVSSTGLPLGESELDAHRKLVLTLLPELRSHSGNPQLVRQMALPVRLEAYVAWNQYRQLLLSDPDKAGLRELFSSFDRLSPASRETFVHYVARPHERRMTSWQALRRLVPLAVPDAEYDSAIDLGQLASALPDAVAELPVEAPQPAVTPVGPPASAPPDEAAQAIETPQPSADPVADLATAISSRLATIAGTDRAGAEQTLKVLRDLLATPFPGKYYSAIDLFRPDVVSLITDLEKANLTTEQLEIFFDASADPMGSALTELANRNAAIPKHLRADFLDHFGRFTSLHEQEQEALLTVLASDLYQVKSPESLMWISLLKARLFGYYADVAISSLIVLPLFVLCLLVGILLSRKLIHRDQIRRLIARERTSEAEISDTFGIQLAMRGRQTLLETIKRLGRRGWNTVAVVGRRGVGKSRILHAILRSEHDPSARPSVGVWVTAPARYEEEEFIASTLEAIALRAERAIAAHLGAAPLSVRMLVARIKPLNLLLFSGFALLFAVLVYDTQRALSEPLFSIAFAPAVLVAVSSLGALLLYLLRIQPVNLTSWLQSRSSSPQTALMYQEALEAIRFVRQGSESRPEQAEVATPFRKPLLWVLGLIAFPFGLVALIDPDFFSVVTATALLGWWFWVYRKRPRRGKGGARSLLSLTTAYREYVHSLVRRIRNRALGEGGASGPGLVICIDELDKIIDLGEVRQFIRKVKGIFEVPGVYYYLSLADDAFAALYLGSAEGKEELDSSFDHVLRVPTLGCEEGTEIAREYLEKIGIRECHERLPRTIAAAAFGIPRDILRLCDDVGAASEDDLAKYPERLIGARRRLQVRLAYELLRLDREDAHALGADAASARERAKGAFRSGHGPGARSEGPRTIGERSKESERVVLAAWVLALLEVAFSCESDQEWPDRSEKIREIGSKIPTFPSGDLAEEVLELDRALDAGAGAAEAQRARAG